MGMINGGTDVKWVKTSNAATKREESETVCPLDEKEEIEASQGRMSRLKSWVKNAVNCCIE